MATFELSAVDRRVWESLQRLPDDDLYAMLGVGGSPDFEPSSTPESLLFGVRFDKTELAIEAGRARFWRLLQACREAICRTWRSLKSQTVFRQDDIAAIVSGVVKQYVDESSPFSTMPLVELVCRSCSYSLNALCKDVPED